MAKTVKFWVFVREDGMPRQVCVEIPSSTEVVPEAGRWVAMTGELPAPEPASGPGPDRELTMLDGTVYRKVGSNGMNAYEELDRLGKERNEAWERMLRAMKLVSEVREMCARADTKWLDLSKKLDALHSILSHKPESRTPV